MSHFWHVRDHWVSNKQLVINNSASEIRRTRRMCSQNSLEIGPDSRYIFQWNQCRKRSDPTSERFWISMTSCSNWLSILKRLRYAFKIQSRSNGSQLKNPDISGAILTLSLSILILNCQCVEGARDVRVLQLTPIMSDPTLSDSDFKTKWIWSGLPLMQKCSKTSMQFGNRWGLVMKSELYIIATAVSNFLNPQLLYDLYSHYSIFPFQFTLHLASAGLAIKS